MVNFALLQRVCLLVWPTANHKTKQHKKTEMFYDDFHWKKTVDSKHKATHALRSNVYECQNNDYGPCAISCDPLMAGIAERTNQFAANCRHGNTLNG